MPRVGESPHPFSALGVRFAAVATLVWGCVWGSLLVAQEPPPAAGAPGRAQPRRSTEITQFRTPDGSRFVLIPTAGTSMIHWAQATPCSLLEDVPGFEGLTRAVHEQSLFGTTELGSRDPAREGFLAEGIVERRAALAQQLLRGVAPDPQDLAELAEWQKEILTLRDRGAYRRLVRSAPAQGPELSLSESTAVVLVSTDATGLRRVAELLLQRREDAALFGAGERFEQERLERIREWTEDPSARIRSEVAALAFLDGPLRRLGLAPGSARVASTAAIQAAWHRSQHPARSVHVLVGDIEVAAVQAILNEVFDRTRLPAPEAALPPLNQERAQRQAALSGAPTAAVFIAMPVPTVRPAVADAALRWLGQGDASALRVALVDAGLRDFQLAFRYPFPPGLGHRASEGMLLLEARMGPTDPRAANIDFLRAHLLKAVADARVQAPPPAALAVFNAALATEQNAKKRQPSELAVVLARALLEGQRPQDVLKPWQAVTEAECRAFLRDALAPARRIMVTWRPK